MKRWIVVLLAMGCGGRMDLGSVGTGDASDTSASDAATMGCTKPRWIVFDYDDPVTNEFRIYAMHPDGSSMHAVDLDGKRGALPSVSPDGTKLLYVQFVNSDETLKLRDLATQTSTVLVWPTTVTYYWSAVSPDDQLVVYSNAYGNLYAVSADGSGQHLLAQPSNGVAGFPVFSTDSSNVYFEAAGSLASIRADGTDLQVLTPSKATDMVGDGLALSPDGTRVVVPALCNSKWGLRVLALSGLPGDPCTLGSMLAPLQGGSGPVVHPSWSESDLIVYADANNLFVVNAAGGTPVNVTSQLTASGGWAGDPVWAPGCSNL